MVKEIIRKEANKIIDDAFGQLLDGYNTILNGLYCLYSNNGLSHEKSTEIALKIYRNVYKMKYELKQDLENQLKGE